jgi:phosphoadenosine phosphosulfate reductase
MLARARAAVQVYRTGIVTRLERGDDVTDITTDTQLQHEVAEQSQRFERVTPDEIIAWTFDRFGDDVVYACSFEDVALLHMIREQRPRTEVIFLDTEGHFAATYEFVDQLERDWSLNLTRTTPGPDAAEWPCGSAECCQRRKVAPLQAAVAGHAAWFTSVKRVDSATRATMPVVAVDAKFGLVKVNPLATWTDDDVAYYLQSNGLPTHPLWDEGYTSIGCEAVTVKPVAGADRRSGRWSGSDKEECGLHES